MVPALINERYVIRFAICAQNANEDDINFAWNVVSEMASDVINICDTNKNNQLTEEIKRIASIEEEVEAAAVAEQVVVDKKVEEIKEEKEEAGEDEVFLYDDNIPSIPSIPSTYEEDKNGPKPYRRRNLLLRMISDPKCYNPRVLRGLSQDNKRHKSDPKSPLENSENGVSEQ